MKKMKTTIAVALAACVSTSLFAQTFVKQDTITFALTGTKQLSVSTSATLQNAGNWSQGPMFYKSAPVKMTDRDIINDIGFVLYQNAKHYSSKAKLVLVQGELSGFFNLVPNDLALSEPDRDTSPPPNQNGVPLGTVDGWFNDAGFTSDNDVSTALANSFDSTVFQLDNGRHWDVNPLVLQGVNTLPVGHLQPWGQIFVQDPSTTDDNVTYFFAISVQECYDCFYLNSYVTTATFKKQTTSSSGPPCCSSESVIVGNGVDKYYMTLSFDDTLNNPYLDPGVNQVNNNSSLYIGDEVGTGKVAGLGGPSSTIPGDGIQPDTIYRTIPYNAAYNTAILSGATTAEAVAAAKVAGFIDPIKAQVGFNEPYIGRFTLNGVMTYTWKLGFIDKTDLNPDFLGTGKYVANGYGFIALFCTIFDCGSTVTFSEKSTKLTSDIVLDQPWSDWWYGIGAEYYTVLDEQGVPIENHTPFENWIENGGSTGLYPYVWNSTGESGAENQYQAQIGPIYPSPINVSTSLSYHENFNNQYPAHSKGSITWSAWPSPAWVGSFYMKITPLQQ